MVECPHCSQQTEFKRLCSHCGGIVIHTTEEKFNLMADSVQKVLQVEATKRKNKKSVRNLVYIVIILAVLTLIMGYVALRM
ncbi:hypothetical protein OB236_39420 [Paenibacillus sp. WQ 127069]|uniref:DUF2116 family Zn-ribbon domain-containing protein n=1 Tax=Paenibacillus baimaensis TaxID=2982185 RepID=A0ABT2UU71_9BACL|nr:hypothetical protein [Paenibacillus sp. WQ 127069]MCU6798215.1 hypothetical protein [Paenibacillus sp. WQ 127069]